jgi:ribonuclease P protein component
VVHVREREVDGLARLGLVVPGAVGTAVQRNRLKRQIRVAWRALRSSVAPMDCVVVVRRRAVGTAYAELAAHMETCLRSLKALTELTEPTEPSSVAATGGTP